MEIKSERMVSRFTAGSSRSLRSPLQPARVLAKQSRRVEIMKARYEHCIRCGESLGERHLCLRQGAGKDRPLGEHHLCLRQGAGKDRPLGERHLYLRRQAHVADRPGRTLQAATPRRLSRLVMPGRNQRMDSSNSMVALFVVGACCTRNWFLLYLIQIYPKINPLRPTPPTRLGMYPDHPWSVTKCRVVLGRPPACPWFFQGTRCWLAHKPVARWVEGI
jgi:hypothetical protein